MLHAVLLSLLTAQDCSPWCFWTTFKAERQCVSERFKVQLQYTGALGWRGCNVKICDRKCNLYIWINCWPQIGLCSNSMNLSDKLLLRGGLLEFSVDQPHSHMAWALLELQMPCFLQALTLERGKEVTESKRQHYWVVFWSQWMAVCITQQQALHWCSKGNSLHLLSQGACWFPRHLGT